MKTVETTLYSAWNHYKKTFYAQIQCYRSFSDFSKNTVKFQRWFFFRCVLEIIRLKFWKLHKEWNVNAIRRIHFYRIVLTDEYAYERIPQRGLLLVLKIRKLAQQHCSRKLSWGCLFSGVFQFKYFVWLALKVPLTEIRWILYFLLLENRGKWIFFKWEKTKHHLGPTNKRRKTFFAVP